MGVSALVQLVMVPIYMHTIGTEGFGSLAMLLSFIHLASVGLIWINGGSSRVIAECAAREDWEGASGAYSLAEIIYISYGLLVAVLFLFAVSIYGDSLFIFPAGMDATSIWLLAIAFSLHVILQFDFNFHQIAYKAAKFHWISNILQVFNSLLFLMMAVPLLLLTEKIHYVFFCMAASTLFTRLGCSYGWHYVQRKDVYVRFRIPGRDSLPLLRRLIGKMGAKYAAYGVLARLSQMDTLLIGWLGGNHAAGLFALLIKIPDLCIQMIGRMSSTAEPYFIHYDARGEDKRLSEAFRKGWAVTIIVSLLLAVLFALFGHWALAIWVGGENVPDSAIPYILAGMMVFWIGATRWPVRCAYALMKLRSLCIVTFIDGVAKIVLILFLFDTVNFLAPLWAINLEFIFGVLFLYVWLGRKML